MGELTLNGIACSKCGISGIHACPGKPLLTPTPEDEARMENALREIFPEKDDGDG